MGAATDAGHAQQLRKADQVDMARHLERPCQAVGGLRRQTLPTAAGRPMALQIPVPARHLALFRACLPSKPRLVRWSSCPSEEELAAGCSSGCGGSAGCPLRCEAASTRSGRGCSFALVEVDGTL